MAITRERIQKFAQGELPLRPLGKPIHQPTGKERIAQLPLAAAKGEVVNNATSEKAGNVVKPNIPLNP